MMVEASSEQGRELLRQLLAVRPEWAEGLVEGSPGESWADSVPTKLLIPSEHPTIRIPLTIELNGTLQLFWHGGYFYDFIGKDQAADAFAFLQRFFVEEVRCHLCWSDGKVVAGGPQEDDDDFELGNYDRMETWSWRGNRDEEMERTVLR